MNNIVLITGGSGGIGFELAKIYARKKMNLLLVSRNEDKLEEKAIFLRENYGVEVDYIPHTYPLLPFLTYCVTLLSLRILFHPGLTLFRAPIHP